MHVLTYTCPEAPPAQRHCAMVIHDNGSRAPVNFFAADHDAAEANARAWYESELEHAKKKAAPRKARAKGEAEAATVADDEDYV